MKKIVVPIDFSDDSITALKKAVHMAQKMVAEISLIHVKKERTFASFFTASDQDIHDEEVERNFDSLLASIDHAGVPIDYHIRKGRVAAEVTHFANQNNAYLIVMGTHGATGFEEFWMGSNAYKVVTSSDCPVLTTRGGDDHIEIKKIVLPLDTTITTRQKVPFTVELASFFNAEVHVIGVCIDETEEFVAKLTSYTAQVCRHLNKHNIENISEIITGDNPTNMTLDYAKKVGADLISIMTEQETSILNTVLGPYAAQMVNHSPIPVLTMHRNPDLEGNVSII